MHQIIHEARIFDFLLPNDSRTSEALRLWATLNKIFAWAYSSRGTRRVLDINESDDEKDMIEMKRELLD